MVKAQSLVRQPCTGATASLDRCGSKEAIHQVQPARHAASSDQVQIQMYLSKLKELVPHMPKNRKVSKLEVIQNVIDYICQLQTTLESQPRRRGGPAANTPPMDLVGPVGSAQSPVNQVRQPLGLLTSITNVSTACYPCESNQSNYAADKNVSDCDVRS